MPNEVRDDDAGGRAHEQLPLPDGSSLFAAHGLRSRAVAASALFFAVPRAEGALATAQDAITQLRGAGLEVTALESDGALAQLCQGAAPTRLIIACDATDQRALRAAWIAGLPMRCVVGPGAAGPWATHVVSDAQQLVRAIEAASPDLSPQAGLPLLLKRALDLSVAVPSLLVALPVMLGTAAAVRVWLGSPVLFSQTRPGKHGRPFRIFKFRTMTNERGSDGELLPDAARLTRLGRILRASSLDELPQLLNVVLGQMSLVGPRPLLVSYLERYSVEQRRRHNVLPGITGLAQVNGRNATTWEERLGWDVRYADNWSLRHDLAILLQTLATVLHRSGVSQPGHATMPEFTGASPFASQ